jgi:phospholipid/cholesterol/gamma-HCH transport system substrate-binding protein
MNKSKTAKVGIFLVGGVLLFALGLFLIGNHNQMFGHHFVAYTEFQSMDTLQSGAEVFVSGMDAGQVSRITVPRNPSEKFRLTLSINQSFHDIVRQDSVTSIETQGMVGSKYVNVAVGTANSPECQRCLLPSQPPVEMGELLKKGNALASELQASVADLRRRADQALANITDATGHADQMIASMQPNVEKMAANGAHITTGVDQIVSDVRAGRGVAGTLLSDPAAANNAAMAIADAKDSSANVKQASANINAIASQLRKENLPAQAEETLANAQEATGEVKNAIGSFLAPGPGGQTTADALRETVDESQRTAGNLASDTEAIKHNFFLRGFFHRRGYYNLTQMNPSEYAKSDFVKHARQRISLPASKLFVTSPGGSQKLSADGRTTLDQAMSKLVPYLPNNPIMIEGYAGHGTQAQRYLASKQRATEVEQYLESHFQLKPELMGTIALGGGPPRGMGEKSFDGVCLALVVSR